MRLTMGEGARNLSTLSVNNSSHGNFFFAGRVTPASTSNTSGKRRDTRWEKCVSEIPIFMDTMLKKV